MMKNNKLGIWAIGIIMGILFTTACDPQYTAPVSFDAPDSTLVDFTITQGATAFDVVLQNTSQIDGIVKWDLGNGTITDGEQVSTKYRLPGNYTIKLTVFSRGGSATKTKVFEQTETDYSLFTDPNTINLSGGVDAVNGKTWVIDSLNGAHFGVGPAGGTWPEWWGASPLQKTQGGCYDDEFTFKVDEFAAIMTNNGNNYVSAGASNYEFFTNLVEVDGTDFRVNYTPQPGKWSIDAKDGANYLTLTAATPLFFGFYNGTVGNTFRIDELTENSLKVSCIGFDNNRWYYNLIPKGYTKPKIVYDLSVAATANENEYSVALTNVVLNGLTVDNITFDFGNGQTATSTSASDVKTVTYLRAGTYNVTVTVFSGEETFVKTSSIVVANNSSSYVPYLLDAMVMYNDFGETTWLTVLGQDCAVSTVSNPNNTLWPNRSNNVASYKKDFNQWANAYAQLPTGYRFDLTQQHIFKIQVYGTAGHKVLLKLENTDKGGNAWQTGTYDVLYTIQKSNTWEIAEFNFAGVGAGWDWTGDIFTGDVTTDPNFNNGFYNVVRIMYQPGDGSQSYSFYFDDLAGPHVEGLK